MTGKHRINIAGTSLETSHVVEVPCELVAEVERLRGEIATLDADDDKLMLAEQEIERLRAQLKAEHETAVAAIAGSEKEIERLRGFLKHLKGEAQDRDDLQTMNEIDVALSRHMVAERDEQIEDSRAEIERLTKSNGELLVDLVGTGRERDQALAELHRLRTEKTRLQGDIERLRAALEDIKQRSWQVEGRELIYSIADVALTRVTEC